MYRFTDAADWQGAGLSECFREDAACLVEWPERGPGMLSRPDLALALRFAPRGEGRILEVQSHSIAGERCRAALIAALPAA